MADANFIKEMERELLTMKQEILARLADQANETRDIANSAEINDSIDDASNEITLKKLEAVNKLDADRLKAINNALDRIRTGKYGKCLRCGKPIPEARLRALPFAVLCLDCKHAQEGFHR